MNWSTAGKGRLSWKRTRGSCHGNARVSCLGNVRVSCHGNARVSCHGNAKVSCHGNARVSCHRNVLGEVESPYVTYLNSSIFKVFNLILPQSTNQPSPLNFSVAIHIPDDVISASLATYQY